MKREGKRRGTKRENKWCDDGGKAAKLLLIGEISNVGRLVIGGNRETIPSWHSIHRRPRFALVDSPASALLLSDIVARAYISGPVIIEG